MSDRNREPKNQIDLLRSLPLDSSTEERVEALWRQLLLYKTAGATDLSDAKGRRAQAEASRAQAEAKQLKSEVLIARREIEAERSQANEVKAQAEQQRQRILSAAENEAREIIDKVRLAAQQEATELRRQALKEISTVVTRMEDMSAAVNEELETQRILTNVAEVKATSRWLLTDETEAENGIQEPPPGIDAVEPDIGTEFPESEPVVGAEPSVKAARAKKESSKS